jgi:type VI protein secretion system component Hcp
VTVDVADGGRVSPQPFVITKKVDVSSPVLF